MEDLASPTRHSDGIGDSERRRGVRMLLDVGTLSAIVTVLAIIGVGVVFVYYAKKA